MGWVFVISGFILVGMGSFFTYYGKQLLSQPSPSVVTSPPSSSLPDFANYSQTFTVQLGPTDISVEVRTITIKDKDGKMGIIKVSILSKEVSWDYESSETVSLNRKPLDMEDFLRSEGMQSRFKTASDLIAVGAASEQGDIDSEQPRARKRADQLVHWLRRTVKQTEINLHTLSMGRYKKAKSRGPEETAYQRRVIIVGVSEKEEGIDLEEALIDSLASNPAWPYALNEYSEFILKPAT